MTSTLQKAKVITDRVRRIITITADTGFNFLNKQEKGEERNDKERNKKITEN